MNYNEVMQNAKKVINGKCKACDICNGLACRFTMPGPGCRPPYNTAARNYEKWQEVFLNMDNIIQRQPIDTTYELFGRTFDMPVIAAPIGAPQIHFSDRYKEEIEYDAEAMMGCAETNIAACYWVGFEEETYRNKLEVLKKQETGGFLIPSIKPFSNKKFKTYVDMSKEYGMPAILMDIDGAGLPMFKENVDDAGCKNVESLRELREYADMPFILKGIMTVSGAKKALEAGFDTIVVSNHGGRVLSCLPSTAEVLEEICDAVGDKMTVLVDGGIRTGYDVFRALALGAHGVLIARPLAIAVVGGGKDGVKPYIEMLKKDLCDAMEMCGAHSLKDINRSMVRVIK